MFKFQRRSFERIPPNSAADKRNGTLICRPKSPAARDVLHGLFHQYKTAKEAEKRAQHDAKAARAEIVNIHDVAFPESDWGKTRRLADGLEYAVTVSRGSPSGSIEQVEFDDESYVAELESMLDERVIDELRRKHSRIVTITVDANRGAIATPRISDGT